VKHVMHHQYSVTDSRMRKPRKLSRNKPLKALAE
jgi:hypothetical protein